MSAPPLASMTGFGRATQATEERLIEVDLRAVNHKGFKASIRASEAVASLVPKLEARLRERLARGAINLQLRFERRVEARRYTIDEAQLKSYAEALAPLAAARGEPAPELRELLQLPGVITESRPETHDPEDDWRDIAATLDEAIDAMCAMRAREGRATADDLRGSLDRIAERLTQIGEKVPATVSAYRDRLSARIAKLLEGSELSPDPRELAQQLAHYADRTDISEERQRLASHMESIRETLDAGGPVGRKLDFLGQEMQREANTMISKSQGLELVELALEIKLEVEKIREQTANLE